MVTGTAVMMGMMGVVEMGMMDKIGDVRMGAVRERGLVMGMDW